MNGPDAQPAPELSLPVLIIGGGACGLTAAIRLARSGVECVVIERDAVPAGSTALSSGFIPAAGTRVQRAAGVADSVDDFAADILAKTGGAAAAHLVQAYARAAPAAIDALEQAGLRFELLDGFLYPGHRARRMHTLRQRSGQALMAALGQAAADAGALVLTRTLARELRHDGQGRITAVICERPDGTRESIGCDALILACNGFGGNAAMVREHLPAMADAVYGGHAGNDGSAVRWGRELGAGLADMGAYQGHGSWATPQGALVSWAVIMDGGVQVNRLGRRFHDETQGYSEAAVRVLAQPDGVAWNVFDDQALALVRDFPDFQAARAAGALRSARRRAGAGRADRLRCAGAGRHAAVGSQGCAGRPRTPFHARLVRAISRGQGHRRAVPYPGRPRHRRPLPRAAGGRRPVPESAGGGRRGARRVGQRCGGLSVGQRPAQRHRGRPYRRGDGRRDRGHGAGR